MKKKQLAKFLITAVLLFLPLIIQAAEIQDELIELMSEEIDRQMSALKNEEVPPYFMSYRIDEVKTKRISSSFGNLTNSEETDERLLTAEVRVGDYKLDSSHELRDDFSRYIYNFSSGKKLPLENDPDAIKQVLWNETDKKYKEAVDKLAKVKANIAVKVEEEDLSPDFSIEEASVYFEPKLKVKPFDTKLWEEKVKKYSKPFLKDGSIFDCYASVKFSNERKYFVSSEGGKITQNISYIRLFISGSIKSDDGMVMPLHQTYFAYNSEDLPSDEVILADVQEMVKKLTALKNAPVAEPFTGPALLSGETAGVFFHEIFGHRVEGQRQKSEMDGQTFKKKIGDIVLNQDLSVIFDPCLRNYEGQDLIGYYKYDDQGIKGQKVTLVEDGKLKGFLMSRCPIEGFDKSNGHGRAQAGKEPVTRQSNLIVKTSNSLSNEELREKFITEIKTQGKEYGYYFADVRGGFTMTGRFIPNAFNVTPTEVYRIYADGKPDQLVRGVDLVGTPLAMFSEIEASGNDPQVFTGMCGAESGNVPITAISPSLFVKKIETQKKMKSQEKPPILPRPDLEDVDF